MSHVIPGVLVREDPRATEVPLVLDSPHSGTEYPADFRYACPLSVLRSAEDTYVEDLYGAAPDHGATLVAALFPRSYIDVNRDVGDIDVALLDAPWPRKLNPGEKTRFGMGLIRRLAKPELPVYDRNLTVGEVERRIATYYTPYHAVLQMALDRLHAKFGVVYHLNCHSMPAEGNAMSSDGPGARRADFVLGDRDGATCGADFTDFVAGILKGKGYNVKINDPYKGVELVRRHGRPAENRHSLQVEVNRRLYMDERTLKKNDNYPRLKKDLTDLVRALAHYAATFDGRQVAE